MRKIRWILPALLLVLLDSAGLAAPKPDDIAKRVRKLVEEVTTASYPELTSAGIEIKLFDSRSDYFQSRFTFTSYLFRKRLRYLLKVNRRVFADGAPEDGVRAILAHELAHVLFYHSRNRLALLGLVRLVSKGYTAHFERGADLVAIERGYGDGLKSYRAWLYMHIPPNKIEEKKRNYFSPAEIDALQLALRNHPELMKRWHQHPPRSLVEIERSVRDLTKVGLAAPRKMRVRNSHRNSSPALILAIFDPDLTARNSPTRQSPGRSGIARRS